MIREKIKNFKGNVFYKDNVSNRFFAVIDKKVGMLKENNIEYLEVSSIEEDNLIEQIQEDVNNNNTENYFEYEVIEDVGREIFKNIKENFIELKIINSDKNFERIGIYPIDNEEEITFYEKLFAAYEKEKKIFKVFIEDNTVYYAEI